MVNLRFQRSATTPPNVPATIPGRKRAARGTMIATVEASPPPPIRAARARVAKMFTQSPRLETLLAHHSLGEGAAPDQVPTTDLFHRIHPPNTTCEPGIAPTRLGIADPESG